MAGEALGTLIERARRGDRDAQDEIVRRYGGHVRRAIHGRLGRDVRARIETADVVQSTMVASLADLGAMEFRGEEAFVAWLVQVARRRLASAARRQRAKVRDVARQVALGDSQELPGSGTSASQVVLREETGRAVRTAVERLPDLERQVVEMRSFEGLGFGEIARRLQLPDRHAPRNAFLRALKMMGDLLDGEGSLPGS